MTRDTPELLAALAVMSKELPVFKRRSFNCLQPDPLRELYAAALMLRLDGHKPEYRDRLCARFDNIKQVFDDLDL